MECEVDLITDGYPLPCSSENSEVTKNKAESENIKKSPKVPCSLSFGAGIVRGFSRGGRGSKGQSKKSSTHWHQQKNAPHYLRTKLEEVNLKDLEEALPSETEYL